MRTALNIICVTLLLLLTSCGGGGIECNYELIAHAGGAIDGRTYTNSREALERALANGYRHIELDLALTSDSTLVAAHSWQLFNEISGFAHKGDTAPTLDEFLSRRIYGRYTPLTAKEINRFFLENEELILVTDKISDAAILEENFPTLKKRMIVEAFTHDDYVRLKEQGYHRVFYSCLAGDIDEAVVKHLLLHKIFGDKIEWMALHTSSVEYPLFKVIDALCNYRAAIFTINDTAEIPRELIKKVGYIYTDSIK
ncbi:MAG: hypothetical protein IJF46_04120 [Bacteroidaceae bacterium]|nr:hypothetical protein [Bacteroidaceae bacterium]